MTGERASVNCNNPVHVITMAGGASILIGSGYDFPACRIQKGLVLSYRNKDLSEEGIGFGVPLLKFGHETIFPGRGHVTFNEEKDATVLKVDYDLNLVERMAMKGKNIESKNFYKIKEFFSRLHREYPFSRGLITNGSTALRHAFAMETEFEEIASAGLASVLYRIYEVDGSIHVSIDTSGLRKEGCTEVIIMNEQGANYFDSYHDSERIILVGNAIGTWEETFADEASFIDSQDNLVFTLSKVTGSRMFRGRELVANRLAWAGLAYVIPPRTSSFDYSIRIGVSK